jgi:outer membrane protein OmpA-like peptidoglycan-associated protein
MLNLLSRYLGCATLLAVCCQTGAFAQSSSTDDLMAMGAGSLRGEIDQRYTAALALTRDASVVSANSSQYMWASQAKVQCGIALGFLKSATKDRVSISKCVDAHLRMQAAPLTPPTLAAPPAAVCTQPVVGLVYFDWDSAVPNADAVKAVDDVVNNNGSCKWYGLIVTGHTDRSGSDGYNLRLSEARASAVASMLESKGVERVQMRISGHGENENRVATEDGVREAQNRRVEITVLTATGE